MTARPVRLAMFACVALAAAAGTAGADTVRPECANYSATIYFEEGAVALPASATPLLREAMDRIGSCRTAGGRVKRIVVTPRADGTGVDTDARAIVRARGQVLRKALIEVGAPRRAIRVARPAGHDAEPMQRRTEFVVEMQ